jgi:hypothetical protein
MVCPGFGRSFLPLLGERAQGKPGADCARSPACGSALEKSTRVKPRVQPGHPGFPRAMGLRLIRDLPGERPLLSPLPRQHGPARIDARVAAPGPHDFAVRRGVFVW